jgi:hypothetical protein
MVLERRDNLGIKPRFEGEGSTTHHPLKLRKNSGTMVPSWTEWVYGVVRAVKCTVEPVCPNDWIMWSAKKVGTGLGEILNEAWWWTVLIGRDNVCSDIFGDML